MCSVVVPQVCQKQSNRPFRDGQIWVQAKRSFCSFQRLIVFPGGVKGAAHGHMGNSILIVDFQRHSGGLNAFFPSPQEVTANTPDGLVGRQHGNSGQRQ